MSAPKTYIQVILPVRFRDTVTYSVPEELLPDLKVGSRVEVMLGYRKYKGFVEEITQTPRYDIRKIRNILSVDREITATAEDLKFWRTISDYYMCSSGEALKAATPFLMELLTQREKKTGTKDTLGTKVPISVPESTAAALLQEIEHAHSEGKSVLMRTNCPGGTSPNEVKEIYLQLAAKNFRNGKSTLILTPDIASCRRMEKHFAPHFGESVITYHSGQTTAKRREATKALLHSASTPQQQPQQQPQPHPHIIIGLRSALFLPFRDLGLIIVDEEHSPLYKQSEPTPRYHARDAALILARLHNANILLSSPTPSFESIHNAMTGKFQEISYSQRAATPSPLQIVDFSKEFRTGSTKGALTNIALAALRESASKGVKCAIFRPKWAYPQTEEEWRPELEALLGEIRADIFTEIQQIEELKNRPSLIVVVQGESLLSPKNFRAEERALQQIHRVTELALSGKHPGKVLLQTSLYRHNIFKYLCGKIPFDTLLEERAENHLPPFSRIIQITLHDDSPEQLEAKGNVVADAIKKGGASDFDGPIPTSESSIIFQIRLPKNRDGQSIKRRLTKSLYHLDDIIIDVDPQ